MRECVGVIKVRWSLYVQKHQNHKRGLLRAQKVIRSMQLGCLGRCLLNLSDNFQQALLTFDAAKRLKTNKRRALDRIGASILRSETYAVNQCAVRGLINMRRSTNIYINTLRTFFITSEKNMKMTRWSSLKTTLVNWIKNRMNQLAMHIQNAGMHRTRTMMKRWLQRDLSTRVAIWREGCELFVGAMGRLKIRIYQPLDLKDGNY